MLEFIMGAASGFLFDFLDKKKISNKRLIVFAFFSNALLFLFVFLLGYFLNKTEVGFYIGVLLSVAIGFFGAVFMFLHKRFNK
ncbi:hypothetical protein BWQ11_24080 [Salmonella enterica subsp. enterica serovar Stanley]|uniref:Uncharacterized protein n=1 Tax=Salmonella enterica TaxID=28901 RepID=A0A742UJE9_SALER|nr:hypothetical protein [Salmonella enterica subsp. enterica serovar Stanley]HAF1615705.1 hypothetical protein [Salmonella enterica]